MHASVQYSAGRKEREPTMAFVATKVAVTMGLKCAPLTGPNVKINRGSSTCIADGHP